jgi:hypothetical protein
MGKIGVILFPKSPDSITLVSATDAGSWIDPSLNGRRVIARKPISINDISDSIIKRASLEYNEICIFSYSVMGVFIDPPVQFSTPEGLLAPTDEQIYSCLPGSRFYGLKNGELCSASYSQDDSRFLYGTRIDIKDIYSLGLCD